MSVSGVVGRHPLVSGLVAAALLVLLVGLGRGLWRRASIDPALVVEVERGDLTAALTTSGALRPIESMT